MPTSRGDLTVALKIQADAADAQRKLAALKTSLDDLDQSAPNRPGAALDNLTDLSGAAENAMGDLADSARSAGGAVGGVLDPLKDARDQGEQLQGGLGRLAGASGTLRVAMLPAAAAIAAMALAAVQGYQELRSYERAVISTGYAAGVTAGQLVDMATQVGDATGEYAAAEQAVLLLAQSGKITGESLQAAAQAAVDLASLTGESIESITSKIIDLAESPTAALAKLNEQYNFLSKEVYDHVRSLEEQGRTQEALKVAIEEFARVHDERVTEAAERAGGLERAWDKVRAAIGKAWKNMKDDLGSNTAENRLQRARQELEAWMANYGSAAPGRGQLEQEQRLRADIAAIEEEIAGEREKARVKSENQAKENAAIREAEKQRKEAERQKKKDEQDWSRLRLSNLSKEQKLEHEIAEIRRIGTATGKTESEVDAQVAQARERYSESLPKQRSRTDSVDLAYQSKLQQLTLQRAEAEMRLQNAQAGVAAGEERAVTLLEAWLSVSRDARDLDDDRVASLRAFAERIDEATAATTRLTEARRRAERITAGMADVEARLAQLTGNSAAAAIAQVDERWRKFRADLVTDNKTGELIQLDRLIDIEKAKAQLDELQSQVDRIFAGQQRGNTQIDLGVQTGLYGEIEAKEKVVALNRATADQIEALLPRMRELAAITGNPDIAAGVEKIALEIERLRVPVDELGQTLKESFRDNFSTFLSDIATGTASVEDAVRSMIANIAADMAKMAAQNLASGATNWLTSLFSDGAKAATESAPTMISAIQSVLSAQKAADAMQSASAVAATAKVAAAQAPAAAATTSAWGPAAMVASIGSFGSAAAIGLAAVVAALALAKGFDTGGYTGDGGKHDPAGIVHKGEFVTRKEVTRQTGARDFLEDFNRRGMAAIFGWRGYADGGAVGLPAQGSRSAAMPANNLAEPASMMSTSVSNRMRVYLLNDEDALMQRLAQHPAFEKAVVATAGANGNAIRAEW